MEGVLAGIVITASSIEDEHTFWILISQIPPLIPAHGLCSEGTKSVIIFSRKAHLYASAFPGSEEEPLRNDLSIRILLTEFLLNAWQNLVDESLPLHIDEKLGIRGIKSLGRIRQKKAEGPLADGRRNMCDSGDLRDDLPHLLGHAIGLIESSPPREPDIDHATGGIEHYGDVIGRPTKHYGIIPDAKYGRRERRNGSNPEPVRYLLPPICRKA